MTALDASGFSDFYRAVHGYDPFPWQADLVGFVLRNGHWPDSIDVPTGLGKTSLIDIAVYTLAATDAQPNSAGRRRIFFVVDRRLVVDEAFLHASELSQRLSRPKGSAILEAVAARLLALRGGENEAGDSAEPLPVTRMRGGTSWDSAWVDRPDQPAVVVGTVDQVGSRLLFRGYATSDQRKPMDAALVGTDSLILIDEAHLAVPLLTTARRALEIGRRPMAVPEAQLVSLSATPTREDEQSFTFDLDAHRDNETAWRRLTADKHLRLVQADAKTLARTLAACAATELKARPGARALIVCNTVDLARSVHGALPAALKKEGVELDRFDDETLVPELLIGRNRPIDREARIRPVLRRFGIDRTRRSESGVDVLVATQTVEVGANLDVDVLISECAPLSALIQRIGRLNRLGKSSMQPVAVVVGDGRPEHPVYGKTAHEAWRYLTGLADENPEQPSGEPSGGAPSGIDISPLALRELASRAPVEAYAPQAQLTPDLLPATLRSWSHTGPRPDNDTPVSPYLHGLERDIKTITLVWRDDLFDGTDGSWQRYAKAFPYSAAESVDIPYRAALAWFAKAASLPVADIDVDESTQPEPGRPNVGGQRNVAVCRGGDWTRVDASAVRPGDVVVVPADWGGLDEFGWNPESNAPVIDVRDLVSVSGRRPRPQLRIDGRTIHRSMLSERSESAVALRQVIAAVEAHFRPERDDSDDDREAPSLDQLTTDLVNTLRTARAADELKPEYVAVVDPLTSQSVEIIPVPDRSQFILRARTSDRWDEANDNGAIDSAVSAHTVRLADHHASVGARTGTICRALGLPERLSQLLVTAAEHHDLGKIDVRFQAALQDGNVFMAELQDEPLAKSGIHPRSESARRARKRSGLPQGFRHEIWSAALAAQLLDGLGYSPVELDLIVHLIATHHGHCRPYFYPILDDDPQKLRYVGTSATASVTTTSETSSDLESAVRFANLTNQFGVWGLALLETIVRSSDQTCSREGM